jgi:hypothetical protein
MSKVRVGSVASTFLRIATFGTVAILSFASDPAGAQVPLSDRALSASDLPANYSTFVKSVVSTPLPCNQLYIPALIRPRLLIGFNANGSSFQEGLVQLRQEDSAASLFTQLDHHYSACHSLRPVTGLKVAGTGRKLRFPQIGEQSQAFSFTLTFKRTLVHTELLLFRQGAICGELNYIGGVAVNESEMHTVASKAAEKALINATA